MKWLERACGLIAALAAELWLIFLVLYEGVLNVGFLMWRYRTAYHTADGLHMTENNLREAVGHVLRLMKGRSADYEFAAIVKGETVQFLNPKEIHHMQELAELLGKARGLVLTAAFLGIAALVFLWYRSSSGKRDRRKKETGGLLKKRLAEGILASFAVILLLAVSMGAAACVNLRGLVVFLHEVFFKGESWILNPAVDRLIHLCPMGIFVDGMIMLAVAFTVYVVLAIVFCIKNKKP